MARTAESIATPSRDDFAALLEESFIERAPAEGAVVKGVIVAVENDFVVVDHRRCIFDRISFQPPSMGARTEGYLPILHDVDIMPVRMGLSSNSIRR